MQEIETATALITDDTVVLGLLAASLGLVFWTAARPDGFWKRFYTYVPSLLLRLACSRSFPRRRLPATPGVAWPPLQAAGLAAAQTRLR